MKVTDLIRAVAEAAWEEGYQRGELDGAFGITYDETPSQRNPYRSANVAQ